MKGVHSSGGLNPKVLAATIHDYDRLISMIPKKPDLYWNRAHAYMCMHQYDKAASDWMKFISLKPADDLIAQARLYLSVCLNRANKAQEAIRCLKESAMLRSNPFTKKLTYFCLGELSAEELMNSVDETEEVKGRYFIAMKALEKNDKAEFNKNLQWIQKNAYCDQEEYTLAISELNGSVQKPNSRQISKH